MEWLFDPTMWLGLLTLVVLEIILGIDNLIFIAILTDKLPPEQQNKARLIGLSLAMLMRLTLLYFIFWLVTLTTPLLSIGPLTFSGRDLILLGGGLFLIFKATTELHERLDGTSTHPSKTKTYGKFGLVITQIVIIDAVFSLDSVITAVGMVDEIAIMMVAVIISIGVMLFASKALTRFVNAHQTVIVLCLSFLLMIGFALVAEGVGFKIPKGYLYTAIGFSILIEFFNQLARRNLHADESIADVRERTTAAVLHLLEKPTRRNYDAKDGRPNVQIESTFSQEELKMVGAALTLRKQTVQSIMIERSDIHWININDDIDLLPSRLLQSTDEFFLVCRATLDNVIGIESRKNLFLSLTTKRKIDDSSLANMTAIPETTSIIEAMHKFKTLSAPLLGVVDNNGILKGIITSRELTKSAAGELLS